jgi:hypothetical protein
MDDAMRSYESMGIAKWVSFEGEFPGVYRGRDCMLAARVAFARTGPIYLELVQPTKGDWTASVFLKERGEGVYHLGYWVDDLDASLKQAVELGYEIDIVSDRGGFAYLEADATTGVHMELVSTRNRAVLEQFLGGT